MLVHGDGNSSLSDWEYVLKKQPLSPRAEVPWP